MPLSRYEQETIIVFNRENDSCEIYTADKTMMTKFDKIYKCVKTDMYDNDVVSKTYLTNKQFISFRPDPEIKKRKPRRSKNESKDY